MKAGTFLHSTRLLNDSIFENTIIFLTEYNDKGAMGFVVNKPFPRAFNELDEFKHSKPFPLWDGGPVDQEHLFFLHQRPDLITGGEKITGNIYAGGDFKEAVRLINNGTLTEKDIKLFIGYCGWDHQDLEGEIEEGSWELPGTGKIF